MAALNFFEHHYFLHCKVPRITTSEGKVRTVDVPWARAQSGFTLLFEAFALALIEREMGKFKQTTELFHRNIYNTTAGVALNHFFISQNNTIFYDKIGKWQIDAKPCRL